jgi:hypothetical protein
MTTGQNKEYAERPCEGGFVCSLGKRHTSISDYTHLSVKRDIKMSKEQHLSENRIKVNNLYSSPNTFRMIKSRAVQWMVHGKICVYKILI